jgi:hypothetical protein
MVERPQVGPVERVTVDIFRPATLLYALLQLRAQKTSISEKLCCFLIITKWTVLKLNNLSVCILPVTFSFSFFTIIVFSGYLKERNMTVNEM